MTVAGENISHRKKSLTCHICGKTFESEQQTFNAHKKMDHSLTPESPAGLDSNIR